MRLIPSTSTAVWISSSHPRSIRMSRTAFCRLMEKRKRWGVGQVVFSGREQLAVVRPLGGVLTMAMLNYDAEIRKPSDTSRTTKIVIDKGSKKPLRQKRRASSWLRRKRKEEPEVINLIDALQKSVAR